MTRRPVELLFIPQGPDKGHHLHKSFISHRKNSFSSSFASIVFNIVTSLARHLPLCLGLQLCLPSSPRHLTPAPLSAMCSVLGTSLEFRKYLVKRVPLLLLSPGLASENSFWRPRRKPLARPDQKILLPREPGAVFPKAGRQVPPHLERRPLPSAKAQIQAGQTNGPEPV